MRLLVLNIACIMTAMILVTPCDANGSEVEVKMVSDGRHSLVVYWPNRGLRQVYKKHVMAVRVRNKEPQMRLSNGVVLTFSKEVDSADTGWRDVRQSPPKSDVSHIKRKKKEPTAGAAVLRKLDSYGRELRNLISRARPGISSIREASDVRAVAFLARDIDKAIGNGKATQSLLKETTSVVRIRSLAAVAAQRAAARNQKIEARNRKIEDLQQEIRILRNERQSIYIGPYDSAAEAQWKRKRQSQIDRKIRKLGSDYDRLRKIDRDEASKHQDLMKRSQLYK